MNYHGTLPKTNIIPDAIDNPNNPKRAKSFPRAPINLPDGPPFTYPTE